MALDLSPLRQWSPASDQTRISVIDAHTGGEPLRVVVDGLPKIPGATILEKRAHAQAELDHLRRRLMGEPRGHADMYGAWLTEPVTEDGDLGVLFLHNEGFSTMCGHGIIALGTVLYEAGIAKGEVRFDTPAGRVTATLHEFQGRLDRVSFINVPSFVLHPEQTVSVEGIGDVRYDLAFGGAFYAYVEADEIALDLAEENVDQIIDWGMRIKRAVAETCDIRHPEGGEDLNFLYGTIFSSIRTRGSVHSCNVCIFAEGEVDRSPTGTGVSGRLAILSHRGELDVDQTIEIESILGTSFRCRIEELTQVHGRPAVIPEVSGQAYITGTSQLVFDPRDPLRSGFFLGRGQ